MSGPAFPDVPEFNEAFRDAVTACNGFVYYGDALEAQIRLVKHLRTNPDAAAALLAEYPEAAA